MKIVTHKGGDGEIWRCRRMVDKLRHYQKVSIRRGSVFSASKLSIKELVYMMYEWTVNTSVEQTSFQLTVSEKAVTRWFRTMRATSEWFIKQRLDRQIGGDQEVIEADECQIGRRKYHRGRKRNDVWLFGAIVRGSRPPKLCIEVVKRRNRATLIPLIQERIRALSTVMTDGWKTYDSLEEHGYRHGVVNHSECFVSSENKAIHTQTIECVWRCLRRFLNSKGAYSRKHLSSYIQEFIFRKSVFDIFETTLSALEEKYLCTY
jgi:transposase-like protein